MRIRPAFLAAPLFAFAAATPAIAQKIGGAIAVQHEVSGHVEGRNRPVGEGDDVYQNELIRTGAASAAELGFLDQTKLSIGASAQVKLDRFVYDVSGGARTVVMTAAKGVARFVSGSGPSSAYQVRTPHATLGVRGTEFEVLVQPRRTVVVHGHGAVEVCPRTTRRPCELLTIPGDIVIVTTSAILGPTSAAARSLDVARLRSQLGGDTIASLSPTPAAPPPSRGLFGKGKAPPPR
jgi:hypothetical protein